jgi:hypothetical protein
VTDCTEPQQLFAIAVNRPPSQRLRGSCGAALEKHQLSVSFHARQEEGLNQKKIIKERNYGSVEFELRRRDRQSLKSVTGYSKLSSKQRSFL